MRDGLVTQPDFVREQWRVGIAMGVAVALTTAVLLVFWLANPLRAPQLADAGSRILYIASLEPFVLVWLAASIANVARLRFFSPADIAGSGLSAEASAAIRRAGAILQNTLEQVVLAFAAHLLLAVHLPAERMGLVQGFVILFCLGRLLFWIGYAGGAGRRALGFALTFYPSVAACLLALLPMIRGAG